MWAHIYKCRPTFVNVALHFINVDSHLQMQANIYKCEPTFVNVGATFVNVGSHL